MDNGKAKSYSGSMSIAFDIKYKHSQIADSCFDHHLHEKGYSIEKCIQHSDLFSLALLRISHQSDHKDLNSD